MFYSLFVKSLTLVYSKPSHIRAHIVYNSRNNKFVLFSGFAKNRMVVSYRRFGTTPRSHLHGPSTPRNLRCLRSQKIQDHIYTAVEAGNQAGEISLSD